MLKKLALVRAWGARAIGRSERRMWMSPPVLLRASCGCSSLRLRDSGGVFRHFPSDPCGQTHAAWIPLARSHSDLLTLLYT